MKGIKLEEAINKLFNPKIKHSGFVTIFSIMRKLQKYVMNN